MDGDGKSLWSVKVVNDEAAILGAITTACGLAREVAWAVDIIGAPSALLLALLA